MKNITIATMIIPFLLFVLAGLYFKFRSVKKQLLIKNDQLNREQTKNKQALKNLKASENILESMFNSVEDVVIFHDIDLKVLKANTAAGKSVGMKADDLKGVKCFEVWMENQSEVCPDCPVQRALESKKTQTGTVQSADGNFWETRAFPILNERGEVTSIIEVSRNITERVNIEQQLKEYRLLVDASDDIIISMDNNFECTVVNEAFLKYWQKQRSEVIGCKLTDIIGKDLFEKNLQPSVIQALQGKHISYETWIRYPKIGRRFMNFHYVPINNKANDKIIGVGGAVRDLTREYNLRHEQAQLSMAINQSGDAIVITDKKGIILYVNPAFEKITGYSRNEAIGQNSNMLKSGKHDSAFYKMIWDCLADGKTWKGELINKKKDGTYVIEQTSISPIFNSLGNIENYVAVQHDVTEQQTTEKQLIQAQKMESVGRLAGGVAHDFNNMLSVIIGYAELTLSQLNKTEPIFNSIKEILKAADRSADIVRQLLAFSRKQIISPKIIDMNQVIKDITNMLQRLIGEDIELVLIPGEDLWMVMLDPSQIDQIGANLVVNSRDAMPNGGQITIETANITLDDTYCQQHPGLTPGEFVRVTVSDSGTGMDQETLSHIFEPFYTTKAIHHGTGLGLATVYGIVKQNNGYIKVYSEPGKGATFKLYFPRCKTFAKKTPKSVDATFPSGSENILLVEDDIMVRNLTSKMLKTMGYTVTSAENPIEAISIFKQNEHPIHLLLTDVIMPGMNGNELKNKIEAICPSIKTLFFSGYTADVIARHGVIDSNINFIEKPFTKINLAKKIREVLET